MSRIFVVLAVLALLLLGVNFVVGLMGGDFNTVAKQKRAAQARLVEAERQVRAGQGSAADAEAARQAAVEVNDQFQGPRQTMTLHMLLGAGAAMVTVLVNSITITYFIGTSRWCKEVCETYHLSPDLAAEGTRLKRSTFPWTLAGILAVIIVVGLGAAADPSGANWGQAPQYVLPHYLAAMLAIVVVGVSFFVQMGRIADNSSVIERILREVERVRTEKGLAIEKVSL